MAKNTNKTGSQQSDITEQAATYTLTDVQRDFGNIEKALNLLAGRLVVLEKLVFRAAEHQGEGEQARAALANATSTNGNN